LKSRPDVLTVSHPANLFQIAALPVRFEDGKPEVVIEEPKSPQRQQPVNAKNRNKKKPGGKK